MRIFRKQTFFANKNGSEEIENVTTIFTKISVTNIGKFFKKFNEGTIGTSIANVANANCRNYQFDLSNVEVQWTKSIFLMVNYYCALYFHEKLTVSIDV